MKTKFILSLCLLLSAGIFNSAKAEEAGTWLVRSRGIFIAPSVSTNTLNVDVKTNGTPEFDFSYFMAKNVSLELILAMARHQVNLNGTYLGAVNVLPPTLTAQYHFKDILGTSFDPYAGVGLNATIFFNSTTAIVDESSPSFGPSLQLGADIPIKGDVFLNIDCKKIWMKTDLNLKGTSTTLDTLKINPWVYGIGIGFKI